MQGGGGLSDIGDLYKGPIYIQKGSGFGLGGFFSGLYKYLIPMLKKTGQALAEQAIKSGKGVVGDVASTAIGRSNKNIRQILSDQGEEAINNLSKKTIRGLKRKLGTQSGSGVMGFNRLTKRIKASRKSKKRNSISSTTKRRRRVRQKPKRGKKKKKKTIRGRKNKQRQSPKRKRISKKRILDIFE